MKILFAIQNTGNGHISRAQEIYPELKKYGEVDVLLSGTQADMSLSFPVKYRFYGISFIFGKKGGVDLWETIKSIKLFRFIYDVSSIPIKSYDVILSDFEPISAWASKIKGKKCIALSHQFALLEQINCWDNGRNWLGKVILKYYAPSASGYGFDFSARGENIFPPIIRQELRGIESFEGEHYTVYLPAYDDATLLKYLSRFPKVKWEVFSKFNKKSVVHGSVFIQPIQKDSFTKSIIHSKGVLCGAGFQTSAEALFLGKKLLVIPMNLQYEQELNAIKLKNIGVTTIERLDMKYDLEVFQWLDNGCPIRISFPDITSQIVKNILSQV